MITDIIFDFYGTLVGFSHESVREGERIAYEYLVKTHGEIEYEKYRKLMNEAYLELLVEAQENHIEFSIADIARRFIKKGLNREISNEAAHTFGRIHVDEWNSGTKFLEGMRDFIGRLSKNYRLSIISNTHCREIIDRNLKRMKIENSFAQIVTSIEFGKRKPHPDIFNHALKNVGAIAPKSVYVGDTYEDDYLASKAVGMNAFLIDENKKRMEVSERLDHIFELEKKLQAN